MVLDTAQKHVEMPRGSVRPTPLKFRLLHYLMANRGQIVPSESIPNHVWGYSDRADRVLLKQLVYRLRQKIDAPGAERQTIETIPGLGYRLAQGKGAVVVAKP